MSQPAISKTEKEKDIFLNAKKMITTASLKGDFFLIRLAGGKNNRVFQLKSKDCSYCLKYYFRHESDLRDRLKTEYSFISFLWNSGITTVPKPIILDEFYGLGLYEFIEGGKLCSDEIKEDHIKQAIQFYLVLNEKKNNPGANQLPIASEACFSIFDHINCVEGRIKRLKKIEVMDELSEAARGFIKNRLIEAWVKIKKKTFIQGENLSLNLEQPISKKERCLSPSDFGFHNAILEKKGQLRFIDFEYAGWDDPAKMICDFFCQQEVPVDPKFFSLIEAEVIKHSPNPDILQKKIRLLFPVYKIKWCCIMLNDFLAVGNERRSFALHTKNDERKKEQLKRVEFYLNKIL